jgi:hypothetical protein
MDKVKRIEIMKKKLEGKKNKSKIKSTIIEPKLNIGLC